MADFEVKLRIQWTFHSIFIQKQLGEESRERYGGQLPGTVSSFGFGRSVSLGVLEKFLHSVGQK